MQLIQVAESTAQQALKDRPKDAKITVATLTGAAELLAMRAWLKTAKAAARVGEACGNLSIGYVFAWNDETLIKKRMPAGALVLFLVSVEGASSALAAVAGSRQATLNTKGLALVAPASAAAAANAGG